MKKSYYVILLILTVFMTNVGNVNAQETYYINDNGISFTKEEYDFFSKMYYDGYQRYMTSEDLEYFKYCDMDINNIEIVEYEPGNSFLKSTVYETTAKRLVISKAGGSIPTIVVSLRWKGSPKIRSYDLIGAYLSGVSLLGNPSTRLDYSGGYVNPSETKITTNGFGSSIKLPNSGSDFVASQTFIVSGSGTVYASYQHAKSSLSLANSQSFDTRYSGLGNVFYFSSSTIRSKYDAMGGVSIGV